MKTSLNHLPVEKQKELQEIMEFAVSTSSVGMIVLFGSFARGDWVDDKYVENGTTYEYKSDFDLLFVVDYEHKVMKGKQVRKLRRKMEEEIKIETPLSIIYHGIDYLNDEIEDGNYFFTDILKEGILLYDSKKYVLSEPKKLTAKGRLRKAQLYFEKWFKNANEFFEFSEIAIEKQYYSKAAFELHQATERYLMTLLLVLTDYKPKTHNLEYLFGKTSKLDARLKPIFPKQTKEEIRLFELLIKAYIDSRYKLDYEIKKEELEYLSEKVKQLQGLVEKICKEKLQQLGNE